MTKGELIKEMSAFPDDLEIVINLIPAEIMAQVSPDEVKVGFEVIDVDEYWPHAICINVGVLSVA